MALLFLLYLTHPLKIGWFAHLVSRYQDCIFFLPYSAPRPPCDPWQPVLLNSPSMPSLKGGKRGNRGWRTFLCWGKQQQQRNKPTSWTHIQCTSWGDLSYNRIKVLQPCFFLLIQSQLFKTKTTWWFCWDYVPIRNVVRKKTGLCGKNSQAADPPHPPPQFGNFHIFLPFL